MKNLHILPLLFIIFFTSLNSFGQGSTIDKKATKKTKTLFANLQNISKTGVLFGHQDDLAYGIGWIDEEGRSDVKAVSGSYPALYGWDVSKLGTELNIDGVSFENMKVCTILL